MWNPPQMKQTPSMQNSQQLPLHGSTQMTRPPLNMELAATAPAGPKRPT